MRYWLMKSEPDEFSIDDLATAKDRTTAWFGVRNYQARNFMRDQMRVGDRALLLSLELPGAGHCRRRGSVGAGVPGRTQFDRKSPHYDPKSSRDAPRWVNVDVKFVEKIAADPLAELRDTRNSHTCASCSAATGCRSRRSIRSSGRSC